MFIAGLAFPAAAHADQDMTDMPGMSEHDTSNPDMHSMPEKKTPPAVKDQAPQQSTTMPAMDIGGQQQMMVGVLGNYSMSRDSSGSSWQPDSTTVEGIMGELDSWSTMVHGWANLIYDNQGGPRGGDKTFSESMLMAMAQRPLGVGELMLRGMISLDPLMGRSGYPLLLQTGETANGQTPLIDRQHPHNLFMELAATYSVPLDGGSAFVYAGYPGEPALGPPTFMHRFSGMDNPEAPIDHHWLDSTHVTFGVVTAGYVFDNWKIEASAFNGREPDQYRWGFDPVRFDSGSARLTWNPDANWSLQMSWGYLRSPEQLQPNVDQRRTTASATYNYPFANGNWQTTFAWGRDDDSPGKTLDAFLLESAVSWERHTVFARAENVVKDDLFEPPDPLFGQTFRVSKLSLGYIYDFPFANHLKLGIGALGSVYALPNALTPAYGHEPTSFMLFARFKLI
jgi:hypothetical protein